MIFCLPTLSPQNKAPPHVEGELLKQNVKSMLGKKGWTKFYFIVSRRTSKHQPLPGLSLILNTYTEAELLVNGAYMHVAHVGTGTVFINETVGKSRLYTI